MTNREAFATLIRVLAATFSVELSPAAIEGYWLVLSELSEDQLKVALRRGLAECKFMPRPAELLAFVGGPNRETQIAIAWEAVRRAIDKHDYTDSVDFGPLVNAVVRNLGGWQRLCALGTEALDVWARKEFERVYALFADVPVDSLHGDPHRGVFGGPPVWIQIGNTPHPPRALPAKQNPAIGLVRDLADAKS